MGGNVALLYAAQHQQRLQAAAAAAAIAAPVQSPSHHPSSNRPQSPRGGGARYMTSSALANAAIAATFAGGAAARAQSPTARRPVSMYTTASQSATQAVATNFAAVKSPVHSHKEVQAPVPLIVNLSARFHLNQGLIEPHQVGDIKSFYDDPRQSFVLQHKGRPYLIKRKVLIVLLSIINLALHLTAYAFIQSVADRLRVDMKSCANIPPTVKILTVHGDADEVCVSLSFSNSVKRHLNNYLSSFRLFPSAIVVIYTCC
jgi:pimeloyl-ACP methyl ester carboxylesterase